MRGEGENEYLIAELRKCVLELIAIVEVVVGAEVKEPNVHDELKQRLKNLKRRT